MKNKWLIWGGLILVLLISGYFWKMKKSGRSSDLAETRTMTATQGSIEETVEATGEVDPMNRVEVKPSVSGRIDKLFVDEGDKIKTGQLLALMSSSDRAAILDAALAQGQAEYKKWQDAYKPTPIVAPLSGVVILRNVVVGQTVDTSVVLFALSDKLIVIAHVDEVDIGRIRPKMPVRITLDSYPKNPIEGRVINILYEGKNVSNVITYGVKIEPLNIPIFFRSQMTANISLIVNKKENATLVPTVAITDTSSGEKQVFVPDEKGKPVSRIVTVGIEDQDNVEILSGLNPGDQILLSHKRYTPQKGQASSPLVMGGPRPAGGNSGGSGGGRRN